MTELVESLETQACRRLKRDYMEQSDIYKQKLVGSQHWPIRGRITSHGGSS